MRQIIGGGESKKRRTLNINGAQAIMLMKPMNPDSRFYIPKTKRRSSRSNTKNRSIHQKSVSTDEEGDLTKFTFQAPPSKHSSKLHFYKDSIMTSNGTGSIMSKVLKDLKNRN